MEILRKIYFFFLDMAQTIILAAVAVLIVGIFIARPWEVSGDSMHPTYLNHEHILSSIISLQFYDLTRGDVVVFEAPNQENSAFKKDFIKRIIGAPGDSVMVAGGDVYVNGNKLDESAYLANDVKTYEGQFLKDGVPVTVPKDSYIVFGDNRPYSSDSREWGFITKDEIKAISFFVYFPFDNMRLIENPFN